MTPIQRWAKFLLYANQKEKEELIYKLAEEDGVIKMALDTLTEISQSDAQWWAETVYLDQIITENTIKDEARSKGFAEGHADGFSKGKSELIKTMLKNGATIEQIVAFTGMTKEEIEKL